MPRRPGTWKFEASIVKRNDFWRYPSYRSGVALMLACNSSYEAPSANSSDAELQIRQPSALPQAVVCGIIMLTVWVSLYLANARWQIRRPHRPLEPL